MSAAARAPDDVTPPARSLVRIGAKLAARASARSDWAWLPLVRAWIISRRPEPLARLPILRRKPRRERPGLKRTTRRGMGLGGCEWPPEGGCEWPPE